MSNPIITHGKVLPIIRAHSEHFDNGAGEYFTHASLAIDFDCLSAIETSEITITIEPQPNGTFVTRYEAKNITP